MPADYYAILGLTRAASGKDIKKAYRALAMRYHPDHNPGDHASEARFKQIGEAYAVLGDAGKRIAYDQGLRAGAPPPSAARPAAHYTPESAFSELSPLRLWKSFYPETKNLICTGALTIYAILLLFFPLNAWPSWKTAGGLVPIAIFFGWLYWENLIDYFAKPIFWRCNAFWFGALCILFTRAFTNACEAVLSYAGPYKLITLIKSLPLFLWWLSAHTLWGLLAAALLAALALTHKKYPGIGVRVLILQIALSTLVRVMPSLTASFVFYYQQFILQS